MRDFLETEKGKWFGIVILIGIIVTGYFVI